MRKHIYVLLIVLAVTLVSCNGNAESTEMPLASLTATATEKPVTPTQTNTPEPTLTNTPEPTPTLTNTPTIVPTPTQALLSMQQSQDLTVSGKNLLKLNEKLGEVMGLEEGPLVFDIGACKEEGFKDLIIMEEPCKQLLGVEDKTLDSEKSNFILLIYPDYFPFEVPAVRRDGSLYYRKVYCSGAKGWYQSYGCLDEEAGITPFKMIKEISKETCSYPQSQSEADEMLRDFVDEGAFLYTNDWLYEHFSGCSLISKETAEGFRELGNGYFSFFTLD